MMITLEVNDMTNDEEVGKGQGDYSVMYSSHIELDHADRLIASAPAQEVISFMEKYSNLEPLELIPVTPLQAAWVDSLISDGFIPLILDDVGFRFYPRPDGDK